MCLVSQIFNGAATPWLYRNVVLDWTKVQSLRDLAENLLNGRAKYVRTIDIPREDGIPDGALPDVFDKILPSLIMLRHFV